MRIPNLLTISVSLWVALGACAPDVPDDPSWEDDVRPILAANCVRCHTDPPVQLAPNYFRLDIPEDTMIDIGGQMMPVLGAASSIDRVIARAAGDEGLPPMPPLPARGLNSRQIEVLENWAASGTPFRTAGEGELPHLDERLDPTQPASRSLD